MQVISFDTQSLFQKDVERLQRSEYLKRMSNASSPEMNRAARLLADIITDSPEYGGVSEIDGQTGVMDYIVTRPALMILDHIQKLEAQIQELSEQVAR